MANWSVSDYAGWWGAIVATFLALWEVWKYARSGPRIHVHLAPNMQSFSDGQLETEMRILVTVTNRGDQATELTHLTGAVFKNRIHRMRKKYAGRFAVINNAMGPQLPFRLEP